MSFIKKLLPVLVVGLIPAHAFAQDSRAGQETAFERQLKERDDKPLRDFVQSKEDIDVKEKANNLDISGDVRFEWRYITEKGEVIYIRDGAFAEKYKSLRGGNARDYDNLPISNNDWDVEFNLKLKYEFDRAWAAAHLQFDNSAGVRGHNDCVRPIDLLPADSSSSFIDSDDVVVIRDSRESCKGSGESNRVNLKRAYMGYTVFADGLHRLDFEIGRRKMDDIFTSEIQFSNRFDGVLFKYTTKINNFSDFYWNVGAFIIDERVNDIGYASEFGFLNIMDSGLDLRYTFIDWTKRGKNRCFIRNPIGSDFINSEISFSYFFDTEIYCVTIPTEIYGGFLINHAAKKTILTHHKKKNLGWYAGVYFGQVEEKGDWSLDVEYLYVQAQAVSDCDVGGIGRGNILDEHFTDFIYAENVSGETTIDVDGSEISGTSSTTTSSPDLQSVFFPRRGNANFHGCSIEFLYAITDNLSLDTIFEFSREEDSRIGGRHHFSTFEIEAIYAF